MMEARDHRGVLIGKLDRTEIPTPGKLKPVTRWDAYDLNGKHHGQFGTRDKAIEELTMVNALRQVDHFLKKGA